MTLRVFLSVAERVTDEHGNVWRLLLRPGGEPGSDGESNDEKAISLFLFLAEGDNLDATIALIFRDAIGSVYRYIPAPDVVAFDTQEETGCGCNQILKRSEILEEENNILVDGALIVDAEIQLVKGNGNFIQPSNPFVRNMLDLFESGDDADVSFKVGDTLIPAHELILKTNAPILHSFCPKQGDSPVPIKDTTAEIFRILLRYIYGGDASEAVGKLKPWLQRDKMGKAIIEASNRYGVVGLKLAVETALVKLHVVNMQNVADWIVFADAKTCPLLKEYATNYFSKFVKDVLKSEKSRKLKESPKLLEELMIAISSDANDCIDQTNRMSVNELRKALDEKDLDVDGSKEMLVSRLGESNANKRQRTE